MAAKENLRNSKPLSLAPLTPEEAIRRALQVPAPASDRPAPNAKKAKPAKRVKPKK